MAYAINNSSQIAGVAAHKYTLMSYDHAFSWTDTNDDRVVDAGEVTEILPINGSTTSTSYCPRHQQLRPGCGLLPGDNIRSWVFLLG